MGELSRNSTKPPPEQEAIRAKCFHPTGKFVEVRPNEIELSIPERWEKIAGLHPDRLAVKTTNHQLTYDQLNNAANRLAHEILNKRGEKSEPVALLFEQGAPAIIAILAILKAGKFYVALDPSTPLYRNKEILADATASLVVTNTRNLATAKTLAEHECRSINLDDVGAYSATGNPALSIPPGALAYIVYTSGSTGRPKGVVQSHRNVLYHVLEYSNSFHICAEDRISLVFPWSFNGGALVIYSTLLNGAALFPIDVKSEGLDSLARLLIEEKITIYHSTATVLRQLLGLVNRDEQLQSLRLVRFGGDAVTEADVTLYKSNFSPDCLLVNSLAATECGVICRYFFDKGTPITVSSVPAGYPAYDKQILLLDDHGNAVGVDQIGEIAVKSRFLSPGYWRRPDLTAAKFITDPCEGGEKIYLTGDLGRMTGDGCLYHLGRKDFQVKIRGYRVEIAEVEAALLNHDGIREVAVVGRKDHLDNARLAAYFVPSKYPAPSSSALRKFLNEQLPDYMIPTVFVPLDTLPLTPNGKINRQLLPDHDSSRPELDTPFAAPRTEIEKRLSKIWGDVLSLRQVGVHDNFFELGGHSLAATRVIAQVVKEFRLEIRLRDMFQAPTVAEMAAVISASQGNKLDEQELERILDELESVTEEEAQRLASEGESKNLKK
jgi:amino acid adenylation domain-containing protein